MKVIGVTGGVGTGKSTVARMFEALGARVFDADRITHQLMRPRTPVWRRIRSLFGEDLLGKRGVIDRGRLGRIVFRRPKDLRRLTRIVHPAVRKEIEKRLALLRRRHPRAVVVLDVPLLVEALSRYRLHALVVVSASLPTAARRLRKARGWDLAEVKRRGRFQLPLRVKEKQADFLVKNDGSYASTRRQVLGIWERIKKEENRVNGARTK